MKSILLTLSTFLFFFSHVQAETPLDAAATLARLPRGKLSLDFVVAQAYRSSDAVQIIRASDEAVDVARLQSLAPFSTQLQASAFYFKNDNQQASFFDPKNSQNFSLGVSRYFQSGTSAGLEFIEQRSTLRAGNVFSLPNKTATKFTLAQNLWRDAFGSQSRKQLEAGEALTRAGTLEQSQALQDWTLSLVELYYSAWLAQSQVVAAKSNVERQKRLFAATRLKLNRGTAERADFLQVESSYLLAQTQLEVVKHELQSLWRSLVTNLKLPEAWLEIPAELVPLELDTAYAEAQAICRNPRRDSKQKLPMAVEIAKERMLAAESLYAAAQNAARPDLSLEGSYSTSGSTGTFSERRQDALSGENPEWSVGLRLKMSLENYASRAERARYSAEKNRNRILLSQSQSNDQVSMLNNCAALKSLNDNTAQLARVSENLVERFRLEERRFQIGRTGTFNVILAGDDSSRSELQWHQNRVALNKKVWELLKQNHAIESYLERVQREQPAMEF